MRCFQLNVFDTKVFDMNNVISEGRIHWRSEGMGILGDRGYLEHAHLRTYNM